MRDYSASLTVVSRLVKVCTLAVLPLAVSLSADATERVWNNSSGDLMWGNDANWAPFGKPVNGDAVVFDGIISTHSSIADINVMLSTFTFKNSYSGSVTINGFISVASSVTVPLNASIIMSSGSFSADRNGTPNAFYIQGAIRWANNPLGDAVLISRGLLRVINQGVFSIGSSTAPLLSNRTAVVELDCQGVDGTAGIVIDNGAKFQLYGASKTVSTEIISPISGGLSVVVSSEEAVSNWKIGDLITVGKTSLSAVDETEVRAITSIGGQVLQADTSFVYSHVSSAPVVNLSRNIKIKSSTSTARGYVQNLSQTAGDFIASYVEFQYLGHTGGSMSGVTFDGTQVKGSVFGSSFRGGYTGLYVNGSSSLTVQNNAFFKNDQQGLYLNLNPHNVHVSENHFYANGQRGLYLYQLSSASFFNNHIYGNLGEGLFLFNGSHVEIDSNKVYSNVSNGILVMSSTMTDVVDNKVSFNYSKGLRIYLSSGTMVESNHVFNNSGAGISVDDSQHNVVLDNHSYNNNSGIYLSNSMWTSVINSTVFDNNVDGISVNTSHMNVFANNTSHGNTASGVNVSGSNNNKFVALFSYDNGSYGFRVASSSNTEVFDSGLGYDGILTSYTNSVAELSFGNGASSVYLYNTRVNSSGVDIDIASLSAPDRFVVSRKHNGVGGQTRIYGDYVQSTGTLNIDYGLESYNASSHVPQLTIGQNHVAVVDSVSGASAITQLISIEFTDGLWHVQGSSSGPDMIAPFAGSLSNQAIPLGLPQFYLTFTPGGGQKEFDRVDFILVGRSMDSGLQKQLLFGPSAPGFNGGKSRVVILSSASFSAVGVPSYPSLIKSLGSPTSYYSFVSSGNFTAIRATFTQLDSMGLVLSGSSGVFLSSVTFDDSFGGALATYISADNLSSSATFYGLVFDDRDMKVPFNIRTLGNTSQLSWSVDTWSGVRGGENFDDDPSERVTWLGSTTSVGTLLHPMFSVVTSSEITVLWDALGGFYTVQSSTKNDFSTLLTSETISSTSRYYSGLEAGSTYFFRVRLSTESDASFGANSISTQTINVVVSTTNLQPLFSMVTSSEISVNWTPAGASYIVNLSTASDFSVFLSSAVTPNEDVYYSGLNPSTTYYFRVRISSETDSSFSVNSISTKTLNAPIVGTLLNPFFTVMLSTEIGLSWKVGVPFYMVQSSTHSDFSQIITSETISSPNRVYSTLIPNTTYYFRVKVSTEADGSFALNTVSTKTLNLVISTTALSPMFTMVGSSQISVGWTVGGSAYVAQISTANDFSVFSASETTVNETATYTGLVPSTTYYFRVKVSTETDGSFAMNTISTETIAGSSITAMTAFFTTVGSDVVHVSWNFVGSVNYRALLSTNALFVGTIFDEVIGGTTRMYPGLAPNTTFYFKVKVASETDGGYSPVVSTKTLNAPIVGTLLNPFFTVMLSTEIGLSWKVGVPFYMVQSSTHSDFSQIITSETISSPNRVYSTLIPNTTYYFRVKVSTEADGSFALNTVSTKTLNLVISTTALSPMFTMVGSSQISVGWTVGGSAYVAQISTANDFSVFSASETTVNETATYTGLVPSTTYYFRVKVSTETDGSFAMNTISTETIAGSSITAMTAFFTTVGSDVVHVSWNFVGSVNYRALLSTNALFAGTIFDEVIGGTTRMYPGLAPNTTFYFKVKVASETDGGYSPVVSTKTLNAPIVGTLLNPFFTVMLSTEIGLSWKVGVPFYMVQSSTHSDFSQIITSETISSPNRVYSTLIPNTTYYFRVKVSTEADGSFALNTVSTKTLNLVISTTALSPMFTMVGSSQISVGWTVGGSAYVAQISTANDFSVFSASETTVNETATYTGLVPSTTYYFRVKVSTETDGSFAMNTISTKTLNVSISSTGLNPMFISVSSGSFGVAWMVGGIDYVAQLSTTSNFSSLYSSQTTPNESLTYAGLVPETTYYFRVKISTESDGSYALNTISTKTASLVAGSSFTVVSASFTVVGLDVIDVAWTPVMSVNYRALLATDAGFGSVVNDSIISFSNKSYFGLTSGVTYYFKVKVATESDSGYSPVISTVTKTVQSGGSFALGFNSANHVAMMPHHSGFDLQSDQTIEFWFRRANTGGSTTQHLISKEPLAKGSGWGIYLIGGIVRYQSFGGGTGLQMPVSVNDMAWHHVAMTQNSSGYTQLYLDGVLQVGSHVTKPFPNGLMLKIGNSENATEPFVGSIDEVRIWNEVRSAGAIQSSRSSALSGSEANLIVYWRMDQGAGQIIVNSVSNPSLNGYVGLTSAPEANDALWVNDPIPGFGAPVDSVNPTVRVLFPPIGSSQTPDQLTTISGTAQDNQQVTEVRVRVRRLPDGFTLDMPGLYWDPTDRNNLMNGTTNWYKALGSVQWSTGTYELVAEARDNNFNISIDSGTFSVVAATETVPPVVVIQHPIYGSTYTPTQLTLLSGTASDNTGLARNRFKLVRSFDGKYWNQLDVLWQVSPVINDAAGLNPWHATLPFSAWSLDSSYQFTLISEDVGSNTSSTTVVFQMQSSTATSGDSVPPVVKIVHPSSGTSHSPDALVVLNGTASDNVALLEVSLSIKNLTTTTYWNGSSFGSPSEVQFYPPNSSNWVFGGVPSGQWTSGHSYVLTIKAKDTNNNISTEQSQFFVVAASTQDTISPWVSVTLPTYGGSYTPNSVLFYGTAGDNVGLSQVQLSIREMDTLLYYDGEDFRAGAVTPLNAQGLSAWTYNLPPSVFSNGSYLLEVTAKDASNNSSVQSLSFSITGATVSSDVTAPTVSISTPLAGLTYTNPSQLNYLIGNASDNILIAEVAFTIRDDANKYWDGYSWSSTAEYWNLALSSGTSWQSYMPYAAWKNGAFLLRVRARDTSNNITYATSSFVVNGSSSSGNSDSLAPLTFIYNPIQGSNQTPYSFTYLNGRSEDSFGVSEVMLSLKSVGTTQYWNGAGFLSATEWWLSPNFGVTSSVSKEWNLSVPYQAYTNGSYILRVRAKDPSLNTSYSTATFTVYGASSSAGDFTPPSLAIQHPIPGQTVTASQLTLLSGTAFDNSVLQSVDFKFIRTGTGEQWNGAAWGSAEVWFPVMGLQNWTITTAVGMWADGAHQITARARDFVGNETFQVSSFTVSGSGASGTPPTVVVQMPVANSTVTPSSLNVLSGTAADDGVVSNVSVRIIDVNLSLDWNPDSGFWVSYPYWISATQIGNQWTLGRTPAWPNGRFRVLVQATDNQGHISVPVAVEFNVSNTNSNMGDFISPAVVTNLTARTGSTIGSVVLSWTATGDDGLIGNATGYTIRYLPGTPITDVNWTSAYSVGSPPINAVVPMPLLPGTSQSITINNLAPGVGYFWGLRVLDEVGNRSPVSNSPVATAFSGCVAGSGDGEGSVSMNTNTVSASTSSSLQFIFSVGASGITQGGKIVFKIPDNWGWPQTTMPGMSGHVSATTSNGLVVLSVETSGSLVNINVLSGNLNSNDTVTFNYLAWPPCGVTSSMRFIVMSQASSCGQPREIASHPSVTIVAGNATRLGFETYEKLVQMNSITPIMVQAQNNCGQVANSSAAIAMNVSVVTWSNTVFQWVIDNAALVSTSNVFSPTSSSQTMTFPAGQSSTTFYYRISAPVSSVDRYIRVQYTDLQYPLYMSENSMKIIPIGSGAGIDHVTVDTGTIGTSQVVTITPNGDGNSDIAFINFDTGNTPLSWNIKISKDGFSTTAAEFWGYGSPARQTWDGRRGYPYNDFAPAGDYTVKITAGGLQDSALHVVVDSDEITGTVKNSISSAPISGASVSLFGSLSRYTQTDSSGTFSLVGVPAGSYTLQIDKPGYASWRETLPVTGVDQPLGHRLLSPMAKLIFKGSRSDTATEIWGSYKAVGQGLDLRGSVHFAIGKTEADDGANVNSPEIVLKPGTYVLSADIPGYTLAPTTKTFSEGESYQWIVTLTSKKTISGVVRLANGIANISGIPVSLAAGLDNNADGLFDMGYPSVFANAFMSYPEIEAAYAFPGLNSGLYRVQVTAQGFNPIASTVSISGSDVTTHFTLNQTGQATVHVQISGDTSSLDVLNGDPVDGQFPVSLRLSSTSGFFATKTVRLSSHPSLSSGTAVLTGIPNGSYTVHVDPLFGFEPSAPYPRSLSISNGSGQVTIPLVRYSGSIYGTVQLAGGSHMSSVQFQLAKDGIFYGAPSVAGNTITFPYLGSGSYSLSAYDNTNNASYVTTVWVTNGQQTPLSINLSQTVTYSISGAVSSVASPPYQNLSSIEANSSTATIYTATSSFVIPALRVEAYLINADNTTDVLPTSSGQIYDPAKIKIASVNISTGGYVISGLRSGQRYRVRLNPDFDADGVFDIPLEEKVLTMSGNLSGIDFSIRDGARIDGTILSPLSDNGHSLAVTLTDTDLGQVIREQSVSLVGDQATFSFTSLRIGRYIVRVLDLDSPAKYAAKPVFTSVENGSDNKNLSITLTRGSVIRGKLSDRYGQIVNSDNAVSMLPDGMIKKLSSSGQILDLSGPDADGVFSANVLPDVDYTIDIRPPTSVSNDGKRFLPILKKARVSEGQTLDWGVFVLAVGSNVSGVVTDLDNNPIPNVPVLAYQSLARQLEPLKAVTNAQGKYTFESLDTRVRFFDFVANPAGNSQSLREWSQQDRTMVDIPKLLSNEEISLKLAPIQSSINGQVLATPGQTLTAAVGLYEGLGGVTIVVTKRGSQKSLEFVTESSGAFDVPLPEGRYDIEFLAKNHRPHRIIGLSVTGVTGLGTLQLLPGITLSGTLRTIDGSLPTTRQIAKLIAIDAGKNVTYANLQMETITGSVERYAFYGLVSGTHTISAIDQLGRLKVLSHAFDVPAQDTTLDLTYVAGQPQLVASFIQKLPDGVEALFGCNQAFRNNPDDLDGDGTADDDEFENFVSVVRGNGTLTFDSVNPDRHKAAYLYTRGNETGISSLELAATFRTEEIDPESGTNYSVSGNFVHPFGLQSQQTDVVSNLGGEFVLPGGSAFSLPNNWSKDENSEGTPIGFQAAETLDSLESASEELTLGAAAVRTASRLGAQAYPARMYKAITALAASPEVSPFSSFYDIFMPATVSRVFNNKPTLTLTYDSSVEDPSTLNVYYFNEAQGVYTIENVDRRIDTTNHTISVSIGHASVFTVLASSVSIIRGSSYSGDISVFNFPNPFDLTSKVINMQSPAASQTIEGTMIKVSVPAGISGDLQIQIFSISGELVRTLSGSVDASSHHYLEWDGRNDHGEEVASGIYIGRLTISGGQEKMFKMAVVK